MFGNLFLHWMRANDDPEDPDSALPLTLLAMESGSATVMEDQEWRSEDWLGGAVICTEMGGNQFLSRTSANDPLKLHRSQAQFFGRQRRSFNPRTYLAKCRFACGGCVIGEGRKPAIIGCSELLDG